MPPGTVCQPGPTVSFRRLRRGPFSFLAWGPRGVRPLGHLQAAYHSKQPWELAWWARISIWASLAVLAGWLLGTSLAPVGALAFEAMLFTTGASWQRWELRRSARHGRGGAGPDRGPAEDDGVREPRPAEPTGRCGGG